MKQENRHIDKAVKEIKSYRQEVLNSASLDLEWIPYKGQYQHSKTQIFAAAFCTSWGERIVLHISKYQNLHTLYPEKALIQDILFYFGQFPLTFGWYTTGITIYDDNGKREEGRDSDFFILHQRCLFYNLESPFEIGYNGNYIALKKDSENKHIDLIKVFEKPIIKDSVFEGKYRTAGLDAVSSALLGISKYDNIDAGSVNVFVDKLVEEQKKYVKRDAELVMLLAQYNNCLVLRLMKVFSVYSELDYYKTCNTNVSKWYETKYKKMIERGEISLDFTPSYKLEKQKIGGGHHTIPKRGLFVNSKIYELDVKGMYPTIVLNNNISFDTLNCRCCEYNPDAQISQDTIDIINHNLRENKINRVVTKYWICKRRKGAFPTVMQQVLSDREKYLVLFKKEKDKQYPNPIFIEEYQTYQLGAKLFANSGYGLFANEHFEFSNYKVAECIIGQGRKIHKTMEHLAHQPPFNFEIVFGFTDSIFVKVREENSEDLIKEFIVRCKEELGITVELKNRFENSIFYGKKNRFVAWTDKESEEPIIKGLDGLADSNPLWIRKWFYKIVCEIVKRPSTRFEFIPKLLKEAIFDLEHIICKSQSDIEQQLKYIQRLKKYPHEYNENVRTGVLGRLLGKDKGQEVYWFETRCKDKHTGGNFSVIVPRSENLNLVHYKSMLLNKLKDTLEIADFDISGIRLEILKKILPIESYI
jgi:DNA polymerase elongation subunit (family B)